jgi:hypothetical protein
VEAELGFPGFRRLRRLFADGFALAPLVPGRHVLDAGGAGDGFEEVFGDVAPAAPPSPAAIAAAPAGRESGPMISRLRKVIFALPAPTAESERVTFLMSLIETVSAMKAKEIANTSPLRGPSWP